MRNLSLKTKLLLMMLSLLLLSASSLFFLHLMGVRALLSQVTEYTEDLSTAIDIAQQQPAAEGDPQEALKKYADKLTQLGVKDVSIADTADEVQASTNPANVGKRLARSKKKGPAQYVVRGVIGEETGPPGTQRTSTFTIPILVGDQRLGTLVVTRYLDDFSTLSHQAFMERLYATLAVFAIGMLFALYLSWSLGRPIQALTDAARQVAAGDLSVHVEPRGGDEVSALTRTFNEMVERLRENRLLEERLHFAERSTALGRLASGLAHEIRNPLNFINLSIDHVRERLGPAEPRRKEDFERVLANVKAEISRLNRLVGDFLSFGKPMRLKARLCALDDVLREVADLVEPKARDQGIVVELQAERDLPRVVADPELLKTCLLNLMINGIDAMPEGGVLGAAVQRDGTEALLVTVSDTGRGMDAEAVRGAFEPYFSTKEAGVGLGLALTRKIVEDHGGTIELESAPATGTRARIRLPLAGAKTAPEAPAAAPAPPTAAPGVRDSVA